MKKYLILAVVVVAIAAIGAYAIYKKTPEPTYRTAKVERGDIVSTVSATGTVGAVITVQVGTQVSGTIQQLFVDFNSQVRKGQVIAQIDPAIFSAQVEQSRGNLLSAEANLQKAKVTAADALRTLERNRRMLKEGIISQGDFDAAQTASDSAQAAARGAEATIIQMRGALRQSQTNLKNATIRSPVDGVVISRSVDVGQTVAASLQTPTLFTIAQDLTRMQIETSVDESDISRVQTGQPVTFTIDAYPNVTFKGTVTQVRNAPVTVSNVVTYIVVVGVDNKDLRLKPGMTANVAIETNRKDQVLMFPAAALRFKPEKASERKKPQSTAKRGKGAPPGEKVFIVGADGKPKPVQVTTGIANDSSIELVSGNLKENDQVIIGMASSDKKNNKGAGSSPMGPRF